MLAVLDLNGALLQAAPTELRRLLEAGGVQFHAGSIRGAYPKIISTSPIPEHLNTGIAKETRHVQQDSV